MWWFRKDFLVLSAISIMLITACQNPVTVDIQNPPHKNVKIKVQDFNCFDQAFAKIITDAIEIELGPDLISNEPNSLVLTGLIPASLIYHRELSSDAIVFRLQDQDNVQYARWSIKPTPIGGNFGCVSAECLGERIALEVKKFLENPERN